MNRRTEWTKDWPPEHRCENCGWWKVGRAGLIGRLQAFLARKPYEPHLGRCTNAYVEDVTSKSYVCHRHTAAAHTDISQSLETLDRMIRRAGL